MAGSGNVSFVTKTDDDSKPPPTEGIVWEQPCILKGISSGFAAGLMGYFFGFVPSIIRNRSLASRGIWAAEGWASAQAFALMSGLYTAAQCIAERLRQKDDGWNRGFAGCASGLAVGWSGGPLSAAQSCAFLGVLSAVLDFGQETKPAQASCCSVSLGQRYKSSASHSQPSQLHRGVTFKQPKFASPQELLNTPVVMWLGPVMNPAYFGHGVQPKSWHGK